MNANRFGRLLFNPLIIVFYFLFYGCVKNHVLSKAELLADRGGWYCYSQTNFPPYDVNGDGILDSDMYQFQPSCIFDDSLFFLINGKTMTKQMGTFCSGWINEEIYGNWEWLDSQTAIRIGGGPKLKLVELNENSFIISSEDSLQGFNVTYTSRFKH